MTTKLVCRLLDAEGRMLGWCQHVAAVRGDGLLRAASHVVLRIDDDGAPAVLSIHWADINAEIRVPMPSGRSVSRGQSFAIFQPGQPMLEAGEPPKQRLAPVSVGSVSVSVPVGSLGSVPSGVMEVTSAT